MRWIAIVALAPLAGCAQQPPPMTAAQVDYASREASAYDRARATLAAARAPVSPPSIPAREPVRWTLDRATPAETRAAQSVVRRSLRDPDSARFDNIVAYKGSNGNRQICGTVNARNGYGGFSGTILFTTSAPFNDAMFASSKEWRELVPLICSERTVN
jgi:hypothetical protein